MGADHDHRNGDGNNVILGDSGTANFDAGTGDLVAIFSTYVGAPVGGTRRYRRRGLGTSSDDTIKVGTGNNVIFGGSGADTITADSVNPGGIQIGGINDIILGDDGEADFTDGVVTLVISTNTNDGGDDTISAGNGNDVVFGGLGADTITLGGGADVVLGDSGEAQFSSSGMIETVYDIAPNAIFGGTRRHRLVQQRHDQRRRRQRCRARRFGRGSRSPLAMAPTTFLATMASFCLPIFDSVAMVSRAEFRRRPLWRQRHHHRRQWQRFHHRRRRQRHRSPPATAAMNIILGDNGEIVQAFNPTASSG